MRGNVWPWNSLRDAIRCSVTRSYLDRPLVTRESLRRDLAALGVRPGDTLVVHASLSSVGWVLGAAPTVVSALLDTIGERGTLAMPAATPHCADPATWPVPPAERLDEAREHLPEFDRATTPTTMGAIAETFRTWPGTVRSDHPLESVCARGPAAVEITRKHALAFSEGPGTPFARLHELNSRILLLGVGFNRCTALHFAESLVDRRRETRVRFPQSRSGRRVWIEVPNVADDNDRHFPIVGEEFVATGRARRGTIGEADSFLFSMTDLVESARAYFARVL